VILVTTGTQLPFPRLVAAMDRLAPALDEPVIAQVGPDPTPYPGLDTRPTLSATEFNTLFAEARLIVAHAGIGTVLSARRHGKPLILMPRRHGLGEHRNDHQVATAEALGALPGLYVARDEDALEDLVRRHDLQAMQDTPGPGTTMLTGFVRRWLAGDLGENGR
jgi:UDP-N-acetylglucosamine transferase subunit ALG13